jgi:hypothetical protein
MNTKRVEDPKPNKESEIPCWDENFGSCGCLFIAAVVTMVALAVQTDDTNYDNYVQGRCDVNSSQAYGCGDGSSRGVTFEMVQFDRLCAYISGIWNCTGDNDNRSDTCSLKMRMWDCPGGSGQTNCKNSDTKCQTHAELLQNSSYLCWKDNHACLSDSDFFKRQQNQNDTNSFIYPILAALFGLIACLCCGRACYFTPNRTSQKGVEPVPRSGTTNPSPTPPPPPLTQQQLTQQQHREVIHGIQRPKLRI